MQQRGLATAARPHDGEELARIHAHVHVVEGDDGGLACAVDFGEIFGLDEGHWKLPTSI